MQIKNKTYKIKMGAEQADGLMNQENKQTLNDILSSTDEQTINETNKNGFSSLETVKQNTTQYYYERKEINAKKTQKENIRNEPDSTTFISNRVIQLGKPTTIYEKRVISKTIRKEGNNIINNSPINPPPKILKVEINLDDSNNDNNEEQELEIVLKDKDEGKRKRKGKRARKRYRKRKGKRKRERKGKRKGKRARKRNSKSRNKKNRNNKQR